MFQLPSWLKQVLCDAVHDVELTSVQIFEADNATRRNCLVFPQDSEEDRSGSMAHMSTRPTRDPGYWSIWLIGLKPKSDIISAVECRRNLAATLSDEQYRLDTQARGISLIVLWFGML